jgi:two-component system sensor histidine kinase BaeS
MRLRLVHTLALTLLAFASVAVFALGGLTAWQLRHGFGEYLSARDVQHFERFVGVVEARLARGGGSAELLTGRMDLHGVLEELSPRPEPFIRPPMLPGMPPRSDALASDAFPNRIQVLAPNGNVLLGQTSLDRNNTGPVVERPIRVDGQLLAVARMRSAPTLRTGPETRFLRDQNVLIATVSLALLMLALITATWLARRWTKPLTAVQEATQRLAQGELTVRLPSGRDLAGRSDELGDLIRNVNRMAEGLQQMESARRRWLADISHELRTPLTVLRGDIEALHDGVRPLRPEAIGVLHEEVLRLSRLVNDLHLLAISDLQTLPCRLADDDAVDLMRRLHGRYEERARAAGLSLRLQLPANVATMNALEALRVKWDAGRIEQLMANLLENSLRYTHSPGQVQLRLECFDTRLRLVVEDSAPGVSDEQLSQVFERMYRGDTARSGSSGGSGLGLAICQVIAKAHGGQLTASASSLGGLTLTLELPQAPVEQEAATAGISA